MGLKLRLDWYDKKTESGEGEEYSKDLGDDLSAIIALDLESEPEIYDGGFDLLAEGYPSSSPSLNTQSNQKNSTIKLHFDTEPIGENSLPTNAMLNFATTENLIHQHITARIKWDSN